MDGESLLTNERITHQRESEPAYKQSDDSQKADQSTQVDKKLARAGLTFVKLTGSALLLWGCWDIIQWMDVHPMGERKNNYGKLLWPGSKYVGGMALALLATIQLSKMDKDSAKNTTDGSEL